MIAVPTLVLLALAARGDACYQQVPKSLREAMTAPVSGGAGLELPNEADNLPEDIAEDRKNGGTGCLGVAKADFDGDGKQDIALVTTDSHGEVVLVAALARGRSWKIEIVEYTHYAGRECVVIRPARRALYSTDRSDRRDGIWTAVSPVDLKVWGLSVGDHDASSGPDLLYRLEEGRWRRVYSAHPWPRP